MWQSLQFALGVTSPVFVLIFLGYGLKRWGWVSAQFVGEASALIFKLFLPCLLFFTIIKLDLVQLFQPRLLGLMLLITLFAYLLLEWFSARINSLNNCRGEFCQAGFRSNLAFMGLAFCAGAYPDQGLAKASVLVAVLTIFYNILSVITLERHLRKGRGAGLKSIFLGIAKNPLIISISLALMLNVLQWQPPLVVNQAGAMLGQLTLPLALLCVGGSLSFRAGLGADQRACLMWANGFKLVLVPGLAVALLALLGFRGMDLGIPFLLMAAPVATASYVMVVGLGGNDKLAANLVVSSTLLSLLTVSLGLALLRGVGLA